jgi:hypothetical protein
VGWDVTLRQFGAKPLSDCRVELLVDGMAVADQTINVPAGGEANVRFSHRFTTSGTHTVGVRAQSDGLEPDNVRSLVVPVRDEIRVLCVEGREGAAKFVAGALDPNPSASSTIRPIVASDGDLAELQLTDFDCIFLCNVPQFTASEAQRLARYAAAGGGIVFFLGDRVVPASYNRLVARSDEEDRDSSESLIPARIGEIVAAPGSGVDPLDYRHPIVAPFRGNERAGLLTTPISRYYRLEVSDDPPGVEVAATIGRGDPLIVTAPLGNGCTVLVATDGSLTSVDPAGVEPWTIWPTWPSFLPIVRELLAYVLSQNQQEWQHTVGTVLSGPVTPDHGANLKMRRPDGTTAPVALHGTQGVSQWSFRETELAGIYSLAGQDDASQQFALNVDSR